MAKDYYGLLGVSKSATDDELKKAYRKAALKNHPDRGGDKQKFQEISEAYEALSDPNKRSIYDQFGEEGLKGGMPPPGSAGGNPFAGATGAGGFPGFASFTSSGGMPGGGTRFAPSDPNDLFSRIFGGAAGGSPFAFGSTGVPGASGMRFSMNGDDDDDDDQTSPFASFGGMPGRAGRRTAPAGPVKPDDPPKEIMKPLALTLEDLYAGATKKMKLTRKLASGGSEEKILEVPIKAGYRVGTKIKFKGAGNEEVTRSGKTQSQDVVFTVEEKAHPIYKRDGDDLVYTLKVPLVEALSGPTDPAQARKSITSLDKRLIQFTVPYPTSMNSGAPLRPGQEIKVVNEGFPISRPSSAKKKGDLRIVIDVFFPPRLTPAQQQSVKQALSG